MSHFFDSDFKVKQKFRKNNYRADFTEKGGKEIGFLEKYSGGEDEIGFLSSDSFSSGLPKT